MYSYNMHTQLAVEVRVMGYTEGTHTVAASTMISNLNLPSSLCYPSLSPKVQSFLLT